MQSVGLFLRQSLRQLARDADSASRDDVIEHLRRPKHLPERARAALQDGAHLVPLSTPERKTLLATLDSVRAE